jgi:HSP20 family protein
MWNVWSELDRAITDLNALRRWVDTAYDDSVARPGSWGQQTARGPRFELVDEGSHFVVRGALPGLTEKDIQITLTQDLLTLSGERKVTPPEGFRTHRRERVDYSFSRSFTLPAPVDPERSRATLKNGLLAIELDKTPQVQPRQISVKAG